MAMIDEDVQRIQDTIIEALEDRRLHLEDRNKKALEDGLPHTRAYLEGQISGLIEAINIVKTGTADSFV